MIKKLLIVCLGAVLAVSVLCAQGAERESKKTEVDVSTLPPASDKAGVTYTKDIRPNFDQSCVKCHGADKPKARLRLDSLEGALKGGEHGKVIQPGNSAGSKLVWSASHLGDADFFMPPPRNKAGISPLTNEQIGLIRAWIDQGAK